MSHLRLQDRHCAPSSRLDASLAADSIATLLTVLDGWRQDGSTIEKTFRFPDYARTIAFVNAIAMIAQREDHHPDLTVGYDTCRVTFTTHAVGGLTENDFICAAKVDALFRL